jgi:hypothetical protein
MSAFSFPQEVWDHVLHFVGENTDSERDLGACALVNTAWTQRSQKFLFKVVLIHSDTEWRRLHTLLRYTAPHLRRCVRELELSRTANADTGALNWTDLLPVVTHIYLLRSPPDIVFMSQLPSLRHLRVALVGRYNVGEGGWTRFLWEIWERLTSVEEAFNPGSSQQLERVTFEGDSVVQVQILVLFWVSWTATSRAQSLRRVDLAVTSHKAYIQDFLKANTSITDLGLSLSCGSFPHISLAGRPAHTHAAARNGCLSNQRERASLGRASAFVRRALGAGPSAHHRAPFAAQARCYIHRFREASGDERGGSLDILRSF